MKSLTQILKHGRKKALWDANKSRFNELAASLECDSKEFYREHSGFPVLGAILGGLASLFPIHILLDLIAGSVFDGDLLWVGSVITAFVVGCISYGFLDHTIDTMLLKRLGYDRTKSALSEDELLPGKIIPFTLNDQMAAVKDELLGPNSECTKTESVNGVRIKETNQLLAEIEVLSAQYKSRGEEIPEHLACYLEMAKEAQQNFSEVRAEFEAFRARTEAVLAEAERELHAIQPTLHEIDLGIRANRLLDQSRKAKTHAEAFLETSVLQLFGKLEKLQHEGREEIRRRSIAASTSIERGTLQLSLASMDKVLAMAGNKQEQFHLTHSSTP